MRSIKGVIYRSAPFLKWPGGKQWLVPLLRKLVHPRGGKYFEPFLGGASVFLAIRPGNAWLSDKNQELIETYQAVKEDAEAVIRALRKFSYTKGCYYHVRNLRPQSAVDRTARFIYLNRTCWNGLYRVNRNGDFNVPMGSFDHEPDFVVSKRLREAQKALKNAHVFCGDFEEACSRAGSGDTVYLDPPYTVVHGNNGFLRYNEIVFSWSDQKRLAKLASALRSRGCRVIVSNADHPSIADLYRSFSIMRVIRKSRVANDPADRREVSELLITSFPGEKA